jgi:hypothetical protein
MNDAGIFKKSNDGINWQSGPTSLYANHLFVSGNTMYPMAVASLFKSSDQGMSFSSNPWPYYNPCRFFAKSGNDLFGYIPSYGLCKTSDEGLTVNKVNVSDTSVFMAVCLNNTLFVGTQNSKLYRSADYGTNWTLVGSGLNASPVYTIAAMGNTLFAVTTDIYTSTDNGNNWVQSNTGGISGFYSFAVNGSTIYASTGSSVIYSANGGTTWNAINTGLPGSQRGPILYYNSALYMALGPQGSQIIWKYPL